MNDLSISLAAPQDAVSLNAENASSHLASPKPLPLHSAAEVAKLKKYRKTDIRRSLWQLTSTLTLFVGCWLLMYWSFQISYFLTLLLSIPTGMLMVRLFVLQHDCGHSSFFNSRWLNDCIGSTLGVFTFTPYHRWRKRHAIHHATSGDLDRRGHGDVSMMTLKEYQESSKWKQFFYRVERHPAILFGIGAFAYFAIWQRFTFEPKDWRKERLGVHLTNLGILLVGGLISWKIGLVPFLMIHVPVVAVASSLGCWLFYVQHHYEDTYWRHRQEWNFYTASLDGCSYYVLPPILQWLTANIGLHHVHHLDSRIPNYCLQQCYEEIPDLQNVHRLTIRESLSCAKLRLWDEENQRMVTL